MLYVQHRQPNTLESGMDSFRREMDALAPPEDEPQPKLRMAKQPTPRNQRPPSGRSALAAMARDLAIDLGTANTLVYERGRGIVLNEPTVIALNERTQEVLAMGHEAWQMIGRTPGYIVAVRPLRQGAITDFEITQRMIRLLLHRVGVNRFNRPRVVICVPSAITEVERRAVTEAARRAGAADAQLIEQPMAAAIGAALPIHEPVANMVVDVGGGTSETALISLGGVVALKAVRVGSFDIDAAITAFIRREYGIAVGERTAEEIKMAIGSASPVRDEIKAEVRGRDLMSGLPKTIILSPDEVRAAIDEPVSAICDSVVACLGMSPPELAQDLILNGVKLVGGGGMLAGLRPAPGQRDRGARAPRRRAARVRRARRRSLHRGLRQPQGHVHGFEPLSRRGPNVPAVTDARTLIHAAGDALLTERRQLTADELAALAAIPDESVPALAALAHEVRLAWCGPEVEVEGILSAKTGGCPEDCHFCSQSAQFDTVVQATPFLDREELIAAARETAAIGASEFCIVLAVRGPDEKTMQRLEELVPAVPRGDRPERRRVGGHPHRGAGEAARGRGHAPLQPQPRDVPLVLPAGGHHPLVGGALRHLPARARARHGALLRRAARHGRDGRRSASSSSRSSASVEPAEVPLNFLNPRPGTPLMIRKLVEPMEAIRWIALFRLALPERDPALRRRPRGHPPRAPGAGPHRRASTR